MNKTEYSKRAYFKTNIENVNGLIKYLKELGGKELSLKSRRQNTFKTSWTDREKKLIARSHFQNAADYLEFLKNQLNKEQIQTVIADLSSYLKKFDPNEDVEFIKISTNTLPSAIQFDLATRLFYTNQIRNQYQNNYGTDLLSIYAIRMALESRIRGLLGIDFATNNGKPITLSTFIKISKKLSSIEYSEKINWVEIEWVNDWLNHYMHRHLRPYPWSIHQSLEVLKPLINPKDPIHKLDRKIYSFYSATYVFDEGLFEKEIEQNLREEFPNISINWMNRREILK